jgi:hypothetical protein
MWVVSWHKITEISPGTSVSSPQVEGAHYQKQQQGYAKGNNLEWFYCVQTNDQENAVPITASGGQPAPSTTAA